MSHQHPSSIEWVNPRTPSCNVGFLLETKSFRIAVKTNNSQLCKPNDFLVYLWTNIYHKENDEGDWHAVPATYDGALQTLDGDTVEYLYKVEITLTCLGFYRFTFKARHKFNHEFKWAEKFMVDGLLQVKLPVKEYTTWIQEVRSNQITHNIYIGNFAAAMESTEEGFDCLLNMANDVHVFPQQFTKPIIYKKCPLPFGADTPIRQDVVEKIVKWLRFMSDNVKKIMVFSRTGHARSGSILIAYIYFMNPDLSFAEAYAFVNRRSFVYPHRGLKDTVVDLYPRS